MTSSTTDADSVTLLCDAGITKRFPGVIALAGVSLDARRAARCWP